MTTARRVLIVDDQEEVLRTLGALVASGGFEVVTCSRFDEAKRFIDATPPDILITDVRLGAFNGLQLVLHMRAVQPLGPIIVLSAYDDAVIRQETERSGAVFLTKPVTRKDLLDAIASAAN